MSDLTRRAFVKGTAGAAAGMTVVGAMLTEEAQAREGQVSEEPVVAYIRNPRRGEITVMRGHREVSVRDPKLAAQITRSVR